MKNRQHYIICLIIIFLSGFLPVKSQELPPIENYTPQYYDAENQNWSISQAESKYIYVANNKGLLEFNGASWRLFPSPNETIVRSVLAVGDRIYTGAYMDFGYWVKNRFGSLDYTSLSKNKVDILEDEQFWNIIEVGEFMVFQSLGRIYIYNTSTKAFKIVESESGIIKMYQVGSTIYFQKINNGLFKIVNGEALRVFKNEAIQNADIVNVFEKDNALLVLTTDRGFFKVDGNSIEPWRIPNDKLLSKLSIYNSIELSNGDFVLGSISNGVFYLKKDGSLSFRIDQSKGLGDNTVLSLMEDSNRNIWLGLDNGIDCINMSSPFSIYNDDKGILGTVYASKVVDGILYLGTNQGLFYKEKNAVDEFSLIKGTEGQVWFLGIFDDTLFCGHNKGTFIIKDRKAKQISDVLGTWLIKPVPNQKNLLIQGNFEGLHILEKNNDNWILRNKIEGFNISSKHFAFSGDKEILVNHEYKGIYHLKIKPDLTEVISYNKDSTIQKGSNSSLENYNDNILYAYRNGVYTYNEDNKEFEKDSLFSNIYDNSTYTSGKLIFEENSNTLWGFSDRSISYAELGGLSKTPSLERIALPSGLRNHLSGYENISSIGPKTYLLGTSSGYIIIDTSQIPDESYTIIINSVYKKGITTEKEPVPLTNPEDFENKENTIQFDYSVAEYHKYLQVQYQYKLEGFNDTWSAWTTNASQTFENLGYGDYTFSIRAKVGNSVSENTAGFSFSINRPWYLSNTAIAIYVLVFIALLFIMDSIYRFRRKKLLQKTQRELEIQELENKQQRMSFKNESLQKDIEMKNKELAVSTMSLIKKNEFLNTIKKELKETETQANLKPVIKIIDKNINNTDDWDMFQEAFDNADKDFFKRIKAEHPNLTPNDLKLCAYLRLNLSSKEIAPLLNISHRSVEVKRYRLRKKIDLSREDNLTNYILEI